MSKRGGTELNHENWNQEEEVEDAGTFRKAAEGEMKGRVIKRARRRNAGGEEAEKKNVFAGFGGFANKPSATETFSFIGGPPAVEPVKPAKPDAGGGAGFVFGGSKPTGGAASAGFSFGSLTSSNAPAKTSFAFGSNSNEGGGIEKSAPPVFGAFGGGGEVKKDNAASAPPLFGSVGGSSDSSADPAPTTFGSFSFGAKSTNSDSIPIKPPQITEPVSKASEIPSEPAKEKDKMSFGATSGFKFGSSSSEVKVSSESSSSSTGFTFGAVSSRSEAKVAPVGGFAFGAKSSEKPASSPGGFSFGSKTDGPKEKPAESSMGGGFAFGSKSDEKEKPASSGFSFGAKTSVEKPAEKTAGFSSSSNSAAEKLSPNAGFAFGAGNKAEEPEEKKTEEVDEDKGEDDGKSEIVEEDVPSKEYLSHLKALNLQVLAWLKQHIDQNPLVLLSPVFKDYDSHLEQLTSKYGRQTNGKSDPKPSSSVSTSKTDVKKVSTVPEVNTQPPLGQAAFGNIASTKSSSPFSFGSAITESQKPVSSTAPFSFGQVAAVKSASAVTSTPVFGSNNSTSTGAFGTAGSSFSFGLTAGTTTTPAADTETAEEEDTPPVVEIKQVTEEDAVYSKKCKLFYKKDGNYVEKGVGMLYLKEVEGGDRTQLLVRADTNLGNVLLNILLSPQIPTTRVGKNNVMLVCVPNPPVDPKADVSAPCPMLIRVKSGEDADELKEKIDQLKEEK